VGLGCVGGGGAGPARRARAAGATPQPPNERRRRPPTFGLRDGRRRGVAVEWVLVDWLVGAFYALSLYWVVGGV
jgi:hypothetical protein